MNTMIMKRGLSLALMAAFAPVSGVQAAGEASQPTIVEVAQSAGIFNTLLAAAGAADLVEVINNEVPKTVFAPTDAAFSALPEGTVANLLLPENQNALRSILLYHVVMQPVLSTELTVGYVTAANGSAISVDLTGGVTLNGSAKVVNADIVARNGVIHVIDAVILPPSENVLNLVLNDPDLSTLAAAVSAAGLADTIAGLNPVTLFAPTNQAFANLPAGTVDSLLLPENVETLRNILLFHAHAGGVYSSGLKAGWLSMANGGSVEVSLANGPALVFEGGRSGIVAADAVGSNGVIHKLDTVLLPSSSNLVDTLAGDSRFSTLVAAASAAGVVDAIAGLKGYTLFAPTDEAFAKLPAGTVEFLLEPANKELLTNVLLYHVVPGNHYAGSLTTRNYATAVGVDVVVFTNQGVVINGSSNVVAADLVSGAGVVHAVDTVILPPANAGDALAGMPMFSTLSAAVDAAGLRATLNSPGPFTIFAPTNEAFAKLPAGTVETLLKPENLQALQSILLLHVSEGKRSGGDLLAGATPTLGGQDLMVHYSGGHLMIGDHAVITRTEIPVWNGVIHVIDTVLLP